jgi:hypothetical protein
MTKRILILPIFLLCQLALRADLVLEQQVTDTNHTQTCILKLHGDKMRMDQPDNGFSVIADLKKHDTTTLLTSNKLYLFKFGSELRWEMEQEKKINHGTNDMDNPPARPVDTGKTEVVHGLTTEIYAWSGAHGMTETLWVATNFPGYDAIRAELSKLDHFNETGLHRNGQPQLSLLPGMVIKSETVAKGRKATTTLVSVRVEPVADSLFQVPPGYSMWKTPERNPPPKNSIESNAPPRQP